MWGNILTHIGMHHTWCIMGININKSLGNFHLSICPKPGPYQDELPVKALDNCLAYHLCRPKS